jgi:DNA-binding transcriptional LysR family regulator
MQAFVAVAETGSFSMAAARLGVARAQVSKRVAALEQSLGVRLLNRTTRRVSLTGPGTEFLGRSQRILAEYEEATSALSSLQAEPRGKLKISAGVSFGIRRLAPVLAAFAKAHPRLAVELVLNDRYVDPVEEGFDVCLRIGRLADSSLMSRRLTTIRGMICASPDYLARRGEPRWPADLTDHCGLHYGYQTSGTKWRLLGPDPVTIELPTAFSANNGDALLAAAQAGQGVVNLPTFILDEAIRDGSLVPILPGWRPEPTALHLIWPGNRLMPAKLRHFVDAMSRSFTDPPPWDEGLPLS